MSFGPCDLITILHPNLHTAHMHPSDSNFFFGSFPFFHSLSYLTGSSLMNGCWRTLLPFPRGTPPTLLNIWGSQHPSVGTTCAQYLPRTQSAKFFCRNAWCFKADFLDVSGTEKTNYAILLALKQELSFLVGVQISLGCVLSRLQEISHRHLSISLMLIMKPGFSFLFGDLLPGTVPWIGETRFCLALPPPLLPQLI